MLEPREVQVKTLSGDERIYIISKFPAVDGREIFAQYPFSALPKIGEYKLNESLMLKIMGFVGVYREGGEPLMLSSKALVNNHVPDWETLARLELMILDYNTSFFQSGKASTFFSGLGEKAASKITEILTGLLANLSARGRQASTSSKPSTPSKTPS